jgi:hypothetical protein
MEWQKGTQRNEDHVLATFIYLRQVMSQSMATLRPQSLITSKSSQFTSSPENLSRSLLNAKHRERVSNFQYERPFLLQSLAQERVVSLGALSEVNQRQKHLSSAVSRAVSVIIKTFGPEDVV